MTEATIEALLLDAWGHQQAGRAGEAERLYRAVLETDPGQPDALHLYGTLLCHTNRKQEGVAHLQRAAVAFPDNAAWLGQLGARLGEAGINAPAAEMLERALALDPASSDIRERLGMVLLQLRRCREAVAIYRGIVDAAPRDTAAWFNLGRAYEGLQDYAPALAAFERALTLKPDVPIIQTSIAAAKLDLGRPAEALADCEACLVRAPGDMNALAFKTVALLALGDRTGAAYLLDYERFIWRHEIATPAGYASIEDFNRAIVEHVRSHPALEFDHAAFSCHNGATSDFLLAEPKGPLAFFERALFAAFEEYRARLPNDATHPFVAARPAGPVDIEIWATLLDRQGHQSAHIHPSGWLSGVYYVQVPDVVQAEDDSHAGWIEFGRPPEHFPEPKIELSWMFRPRPGTMLLFPSYFYHRTIPFDSKSQRISIAFDFEPVAR
jgi:Tfp pilus assembly protein PilF